MGTETWPREAVKWHGSRVGESSASLWSYTTQCSRDSGFELVSGPAALLIECEAPYHFDRRGATEGGRPVPSTYAIPIPIEAFPEIIERMQFALARRSEWSARATGDAPADPKREGE